MNRARRAPRPHPSRASVIRLAALGVLGATIAATPSRSQAEEPPEPEATPTHEERIQKLEDELAKLREEQEQAAASTRSDTAFTEAAEDEVEEIRGMTPEQYERFKRGIEAGRVTNYDAAWNLGVPEKDVVDEGWWGIKGRPSEFRISGWAQIAVFHDFQSNALAGAQEFSAAAVGTPTAKAPTTGFDAASSRLFFEFRHVYKGVQRRHAWPGVTHILMEMDLGGGRSGTDYIPRVRQFWVQSSHLTFGQGFSTFANAGTWPMYLDRGAPGAFPLLRRPFLRYAVPVSRKMRDSTHVLTPSLEQPNAAIANASAAYRSPDMVLRYDYNPRWGNLMGAVLVRYLRGQSLVTPGQEDDAWVFSGTITGFFKIPTRNGDRLKFNALVGNGTVGLTWDTGIAGSVDGAGLDATYVDATNELLTTTMWGIWAGWERPWIPKLNSLFMLSYVDIANIATMAPTTINNAFTVVGTLMYEPWRNLYLAVEYFYGRRVNFDSALGQDHRLNLVLRYMFNR